MQAQIIQLLVIIYLYTINIIYSISITKIPWQYTVSDEKKNPFKKTATFLGNLLSLDFLFFYQNIVSDKSV